MTAIELCQTVWIVRDLTTQPIDLVVNASDWE